MDANSHAGPVPMLVALAPSAFNTSVLVSRFWGCDRAHRCACSASPVWIRNSN